MARFVKVLRGLGLTDARVVDTLAPRMEALYTASADMNRALLPYGAAVHTAVSRASSPTYDPNAEEVLWGTVYDKMQFFSVRDDYTSRVIDAVFRYVWRHHEADCFVAHLASRQPTKDAPAGSVARRVVESPGSGGGADDGGADDDGAVLRAPSQAHWVNAPDRPAVVAPSEDALLAVRAVITTIEKVANTSVAARKATFMSLIALHKRIFSTVYAVGVGGRLSSSHAAPSDAAHSHLDDIGPNLPRPPGAGGVQDSASDGSGGMRAEEVAAEVEDARAGSNPGESAEDGGDARLNVANQRTADLQSQTEQAGVADGGARLSSAGVNSGGRVASASAGVAASMSTAEQAALLFQRAQPAAVHLGDGSPSGGPRAVSQRVQFAAPPGTSPSVAATAARGGSPSVPPAAPPGGPSVVPPASLPAPTPPGSGGVAPGLPPSSPSTSRLAGVARPAESSPSADGELEEPGSIATIKMEQLMSHFKCTWWGVYRSPCGKSAAPAGTVANPAGTKSVAVFRSHWVQRVDMSGLKDNLAATSFFANPYHKLSSRPQVEQVFNISNVSRKSLHVLLALLLLVCTRDPQFPDILRGVLPSATVGMVPAGRSAHVGGVVQVGRSVGAAARGDPASGEGAENAGAPARGGAADRQGGGGSQPGDRRDPDPPEGAEHPSSPPQGGRDRPGERDAAASSGGGEAAVGGGAGSGGSLASASVVSRDADDGGDRRDDDARGIGSIDSPRGLRAANEPDDGGAARGGGAAPVGFTAGASEHQAGRSTTMDAAYYFQRVQQLSPAARARKGRIEKRRVARRARAAARARVSVQAAAAASAQGGRGH